MNVKKSNDTFRMIAKTLYGLEMVLAKELQDLGAEKVNPENRMVEYYGDMEILYKSNFHLRTA